MTIFDELGVRGVINGVGPATRLGGLPLSDEVWQAMREAVRTPVHLAELQEAAGREIARLLDVPAAYVTSGASAALTLAAAVCMTGDDAARIDELPRATTFPHRVVVQRGHRDPYDRAIEAAGGVLVEIGYPGTTHPGELEAALDERVAAVLFRPGGPGNLLDLSTTCTLAHARAIPVIVDGALVVPPARALHALLDAGADLVAVSGGKGLRGPQASGLLVGRPELVAAAGLHHQDMDERATTWHHAPRTPPRHGVARGMKTGREQIAGLVAAVRRHVRDPQSDHTEGVAELDRAAALLENDGRLVVTRTLHAQLDVPVVEIRFAPGIDVDTVVTDLRALPTPVHLGEERAQAATLTINPMALQPGHGEQLARSVLDVMSRLAGRP